ncbi:hypothetical protein EI94DRAFT_1702143 [Lactarius quietus]|nr:hypothetical protein EI94DRAFT_1702143 [Lactarius quietus]
MSSEDFDLHGSSGDKSKLSGISTGDLQSVMPLSTLQLNPGELQMVLKDTQLSHQRQTVKYKHLQEEYEALKSHAKSASIKKGRKSVAISAELYGSLPTHLQEILVDKRCHLSFKKTFLQQLKQEHANIIHTA